MRPVWSSEGSGKAGNRFRFPVGPVGAGFESLSHTNPEELICPLVLNPLFCKMGMGAGLLHGVIGGWNEAMHRKCSVQVIWYCHH